MFSRMKAPFPALALGPVAVLPECRRTGIASELIREGIARSEAAGWAAVFVLGDPAFYRRWIRCRQGEGIYLALCRAAFDGPAGWRQRTCDHRRAHRIRAFVCKSRIA